MKTPLTTLFMVICLSLVSRAYAFPELPFCPAGGPPGWMNYFNYKRDQNNWRRYSSYATPTYYRPAYNRPGYNRPSSVDAGRYNVRPGYSLPYRPAYNYSYPYTGKLYNRNR